MTLCWQSWWGRFRTRFRNAAIADHGQAPYRFLWTGMRILQHPMAVLPPGQNIVRPSSMAQGNPISGPMNSRPQGGVEFQGKPISRPMDGRPIGPGSPLFTAQGMPTPSPATMRPNGVTFQGNPIGRPFNLQHTGAYENPRPAPLPPPLAKPSDMPPVLPPLRPSEPLSPDMFNSI